MCKHRGEGAGQRGAADRQSHPRSNGAEAGPSNTGLAEPGPNAAITLTQITVMLVGTKGLDELVILKALQRLQADTVNSFVQAGRKLEKEERSKIR